MTTANGTIPLIQPPAALLTAVTNPNTNQPDQAFPLQAEAWLKLQHAVTKALQFPLTSTDFENTYGTFSDEASIETAVRILTEIKVTVTRLGDPQTLIGSLPNFQQSDTAPGSLYGIAVWLAEQTKVAAQNILSMLTRGLTDIGQQSDPTQRIEDLTKLLCGENGVGGVVSGGVVSIAESLQGYIGEFELKLSDFYDALNDELTGIGSLGEYLSQSSNVLAEAQNVVSGEAQQIAQLNASIQQLNDEYIGYTVAASVAPLLALVPFVGIFLAIADAATFGALASQAKQQLDAARQSLESATEDEQKKAALVTQLDAFNKAVAGVQTDGQDFLGAISGLMSGWGEFSNQMALRVISLTPGDVANWDVFMDRLGFQAAIDGWQLIENKADQFLQAGFVQFSTDTSSWVPNPVQAH
jgi:hypothetical protein